jgi:hypothetical protein
MSDENKRIGKEAVFTYCKTITRHLLQALKKTKKTLAKITYHDEGGGKSP